MDMSNQIDLDKTFCSTIENYNTDEDMLKNRLRPKINKWSVKITADSQRLLKISEVLTAHKYGRKELSMEKLKLLYNEIQNLRASGTGISLRQKRTALQLLEYIQNILKCNSTCVSDKHDFYLSSNSVFTQTDEGFSSFDQIPPVVNSTQEITHKSGLLPKLVSEIEEVPLSTNVSGVQIKRKRKRISKCGSYSKKSRIQVTGNEDPKGMRRNISRAVNSITENVIKLEPADVAEPKSSVQISENFGNNTTQSKIESHLSIHSSTTNLKRIRNSYKLQEGSLPVCVPTSKGKRNNKSRTVKRTTNTIAKSEYKVKQETPSLEETVPRKAKYPQKATKRIAKKKLCVQSPPENLQLETYSAKTNDTIYLNPINLNQSQEKMHLSSTGNSNTKKKKIGQAVKRTPNTIMQFEYEVEAETVQVLVPEKLKYLKRGKPTKAKENLLIHFPPENLHFEKCGTKPNDTTNCNAKNTNQNQRNFSKIDNIKPLFDISNFKTEQFSTEYRNVNQSNNLTGSSSFPISSANLTNSIADYDNAFFNDIEDNGNLKRFMNNIDKVIYKSYALMKSMKDEDQEEQFEFQNFPIEELSTAENLIPYTDHTLVNDINVPSSSLPVLHHKPTEAVIKTEEDVLKYLDTNSQSLNEEFVESNAKYFLTNRHVSIIADVLKINSDDLHFLIKSIVENDAHAGVTHLDHDNRTYLEEPNDSISVISSSQSPINRRYGRRAPKR